MDSLSRYGERKVLNFFTDAAVIMEYQVPANKTFFIIFYSNSTYTTTFYANVALSINNTDYLFYKSQLIGEVFTQAQNLAVPFRVLPTETVNVLNSTNFQQTRCCVIGYLIETALLPSYQ